MIARSGLVDAVDVAVAEGALRRNDAVVTSNRSHISQVVNAVGKRLAMHVVSRPAENLDSLSRIVARGGSYV